jgi:hypothetical protein
VVRFVLGCLLLALVVAAPAAAQHEGHGQAPAPTAGTGRVGLLIADHGEPPVYNRDTYESFRAFVSHLMDMGVIPPWLRSVDLGTVLQDPDCPFCEGQKLAGGFIDAWLDPQAGPAAHVPESGSLPGHHLMPGGPGAGEPDVFEHGGLQTWNEWRLMGGRSPNYDQKLRKKQLAIKRLRARYGQRLPIRVGYGIDPRIGGGRQGVAQAVERLIRGDGARRIMVAYHGVGMSDIMQTHMLRHEIEAEARRLDPAVSVSYARPMGTTTAYVRAIVRKAHAELHRVPAGARPAIHLSGHGLPIGMCGSYDCGSDSYHAFSHGLFERVSAAIRRVAGHHPGLGVFHIYGDGATPENDPDGEMDSPLEALAKRSAEGYTHVIDIPFEFDSDSRDTLIVLRQGYERPIPDWGPGYESEFEHEGLAVRITGASHGFRLKVRALEKVIVNALRASGVKSRRRGR